MHEHSLNGIVHVFAVCAALAGDRRYEAARVVDDYLEHTLGLRRDDPAFGIFTGLLEIHAGSTTPESSLDGVCARLDALLAPDEKQTFLLHALRLRRLLPGAGERLDALLDRVAAAFHVPPSEPPAWRHFLAATPASYDLPLCRRLHGPDWRAEAVVLHSPWTGRLYVRLLAGEASLDGNPVAPGRFLPLETGAILRDAAGRAIHRCDIERLFAPPPADAPLRFEAAGLAYRFPGGESGLDGFSFCETGGRLVGVMGGSGTGKSTLVELLSGVRRPSAGRVLLNGIDLHREPERLAGAIGVVPQDDLLFEDLTVRENLDYNARLCLAHLSPAERRARAAAMLRELNQEDIAELRVGDPLAKTISGGQRKRLNIALELIREPAILFVDEPTSGLSSADSDVVLGLLKAQAARGRLVIAVVHQPSSNLFRMFDALWILDRGGLPVYMGHPLEAARHFRETAHLAGPDRGVCSECGNLNPEQIFAVIEAKAIDADGRFARARLHPPGFWHAAWLRLAPAPPAEPPPAAPPPRSLHRPGRIGQLAVFYARTLRARLANRAYLLVNLLEPPVLALLTAGVCRAAPAGSYTFGDNPYVAVYFFMAVIVAIFLGLSVSAEEIVRDRRVLRRERFLHLSPGAYAGAKLLHVALLALLQSAVCAAAGALVLQLPGFFLRLWLVLFSAGVCGGFLGLNVSARFRSAVTVYILLPLLLLPQMLLGGLIVGFDDLRFRDAPNAWPPWLGELTASRWAFEALAVGQYTGNPHQLRFAEVEREISRLDFQVEDWIPAIAARLDALYLATTPPAAAAEIRALAARELAALDRATGRLPGAAAEAAALRPPERAGLAPLQARLRALAAELRAERQAWRERRNGIQDALIGEFGEAGLAAFVKQNTNRRIAELVRNRNSADKLALRGGRLVPLADPVYQAPDSAWGRAPFMAGTKRLGPHEFGTFGFDVAVLWLMNALLAAALVAHRPGRSAAPRGA